MEMCKNFKKTICAKNIIINHFISHNYSKIKFDSCDSLPLEKHWLFIML